MPVGFFLLTVAGLRETAWSQKVINQDLAVA
jgi:hypothetical protein